MVRHAANTVNQITTLWKTTFFHRHSVRFPYINATNDELVSWKSCFYVYGPL